MIQANIAWKTKKAEDGIVCEGNKGADPTLRIKNISKKKIESEHMVFIRRRTPERKERVRVVRHYCLRESPMNLLPVGEKVSEYPIKYHCFVEKQRKKQ